MVTRVSHWTFILLLIFGPVFWHWDKFTSQLVRKIQYNVIKQAIGLPYSSVAVDNLNKFVGSLYEHDIRVTTPVLTATMCSK
jgi:hypothetical protein